MVPAVSYRISPVPHYSGYQLDYITTFRVRGYHPLWHNFPESFHYVLCMSLSLVLQPPSCRNIMGLGFSAFARHYLRNHYCFLLLWVLRCFSSPRSPLFCKRYPGLHPDGLPHSEISGSTVICTYPKLIAACHVLLRL